MEADLQAQTPAAEASQPAAPAPTSESTERVPDSRPFSLGRALGLSDAPSALSEAAPADPPKDAPGRDGKPADEASKPSEPKPEEKPEEKPTDDQPEKETRRGGKEHANVARIRELEAEIASIKSATPVDPEQAISEAVERARAEERERIQREQSETQAQREREALAATERANIERFERLNALPDDHPTLQEGDNWAWLQDQKRLLSQFPQARAHYEAVARQQIERARENDRAYVESERERFWSDVRADMASAKDVPGVDYEAVRAATTFAERDRLLYGAGAASRDDEVAKATATIAERDQMIARLEDEIRDLKLVGPRGLGSRRAPDTGGRSGTESGSPTFDPSRPARDNLAAALGFGANGR